MFDKWKKKYYKLGEQYLQSLGFIIRKVQDGNFYVISAGDCGKEHLDVMADDIKKSLEDNGFENVAIKLIGNACDSTIAIKNKTSVPYEWKTEVFSSEDDIVSAMTPKPIDPEIIKYNEVKENGKKKSRKKSSAGRKR